MNSSHPSPRPTILIAEDSESVRLNLQEMFASPPQEYSDAYGISKFNVDAVATGTGAEEKLRNALRQWKPYDIISLDLGLPKRPGDNPSPAVGLQILMALSDGPLKGAGAAVVINTVHTDIPTLLGTLRVGVADFVPKPCGTEDFFRSVTLAYKKARLAQQAQWDLYKIRRHYQWLMVQACSQVADSMARAVSGGLGEILSRTRELGDLIYEQLMLDPKRDSDHPFFSCLEGIREAATATVQRFAAARTAAMPAPSLIEAIDLSHRVEEALDRLRLGLAYRHVQVSVEKDGDFFVLASDSELDLLLEEMLFGAIEASGEEQKITVKVAPQTETGTVIVEVCDHGPAIKPWFGERLAKNEELDQADERGWRLSVAEKVALNVGGRLEVEAPESENRVTLALSEAH